MITKSYQLETLITDLYINKSYIRWHQMTRTNISPNFDRKKDAINSNHSNRSGKWSKKEREKRLSYI